MVEIVFWSFRQGRAAEHVVSDENLFQILGQFFAPVEHLQDEFEHFVVGIAREQCLPGHELNEDTPDGPHVDCVLICV